MVVFTCGHCGESVQKPKVEKHYMTKCRNRNPNLSCMDCFKDFLGTDYESHIKCITEEERYSAKGFTAKEKKGERKQNSWIEMLQSVLDEQQGAPKNVLRIIETISKHNNTPRKKPKFINFVKNVCGQKTNPKDIDQAWDLISVKLAELSNANNQNKNQKKDTVEIKGDNQNGSIDDSGAKDEDPNEEKEVEKENEEIDNKDTKDEEDTNSNDLVDDKKLSKKQRKEEKKRQKYEAQLQSAEAPLPEEAEEEVDSKKGKKKKNRTNSANHADEEQGEGKGKNKKRKRLDTVNGNHEIGDTGSETVVSKEKTLKKKIKTEEEELEESICLHDQNVAKIEELSVSKENFDWHGVIMSILQKKGDEVPFKRLQKKVLGEYSETTGREVDDRIAEKFIKKLKSAPNVRVDKNRVLLIN